jgi:hypothetical protein
VPASWRPSADSTLGNLLSTQPLLVLLKLLDGALQGFHIPLELRLLHKGLCTLVCGVLQLLGRVAAVEAGLLQVTQGCLGVVTHPAHCHPQLLCCGTQLLHLGNKPSHRGCISGRAAPTASLRYRPLKPLQSLLQTPSVFLKSQGVPCH